MPEYILKIAAQSAMSEQEAAEYAPLWGDGGAGACMYNGVTDPDNCRAIIAHVSLHCMPEAERRAAAGDSEFANDPAQLQRLKQYCRAVIDAAESWESLSPVARGFVECLFFMAPDDGDISGEAGFGDLAPESVAQVVTICAAFETAAGDDIKAPGYSLEQAGRDLCFEMQGAGVGFRDRDELDSPGLWESFGSPRIGESGYDEFAKARENNQARRLSAIAKGLGTVDGLYRGDDDRVYLSAYGKWSAAA